MWETIKIWKRYTKSQHILRHESPCNAVFKAAHSQFWLFVSYVQPLWLYTGIRSMHARMNNPLNPFITAEAIDFLIIWLIILISIVFLVFPFLLLGKLRMKNSGKITEYCCIRPLYRFQISAQLVNYSSRNGFPDY